jgi:alpha-glucosidase/alpha-D-xyloside xylohydrolase
MRALCIDFQDDPHCGKIKDQFMFGDSIMVCPVVKAGAVKRMVYLPAGCDWYGYFKYERFAGGRYITIDAPLGVLPLFVKAGGIIPVDAEPGESTRVVKRVRLDVYGDGGVPFDYYEDDGISDAHKNGSFCRINILCTNPIKFDIINGNENFCPEFFVNRIV